MSGRFIWLSPARLGQALKSVPLFFVAAVLVACGDSDEPVQPVATSAAVIQTATLPPGMASSVQRQVAIMHFMLKITWDQLGEERKGLMEDGFEKGFFELDPQKLTEDCKANLETLKLRLVQVLGRLDYPTEQEILDLLVSNEAQSCRLNDLEIIGYFEKLRALTR